MAESYPYEESAAADLVNEYQRLLRRLKQDEVQLAADQRQLRQLRVSLERYKAELDSRQKELDAALAAFQQQREAFEARKHSDADGLDAQRTALFRREEELAQRAAQLDQIAQEQLAREQQLDSQQRDLLERERQSQSLAERLAAERRALEERRASLDRREADLHALALQLDSQQQDAGHLASQREHLQRREAELQEQFECRRRELHAQIQLRQKELDEQEAALRRDRKALEALHEDLKSRKADMERCQADLQVRSERLARDCEELKALQDALHRRQEEQSAIDARLAEKERQLQDLETELTRRLESTPSAPVESTDQAAAPRDPQLVAAGEQIAALSRRLQALQAEAAQLRQQGQAALAQRDDLSRQCDALQTQINELLADRGSSAAVVETPAAASVGPADDIATLAAQAARTRRLSRRTDAATLPGGQRAGLLLAAAVAVLVGGIVGLVLLHLVPARYWLEARVTFAKDSPLAASRELARAQRDLGGRLAEARIPGLMLPADRPPVVADIRMAELAVQVLTVTPEPSRAGLADLLAKYHSELEGNIQDAARLQQERELADFVASTEAQIEAFTAERQALLAQVEKFEPLGKAYDSALALAEQTRKELAEANRRNEDIAARLRVLRRTPPGARVELSPERLAAAAASDVQLAEVRSQVTARAAELRTLLESLLTNATAKCDQMDAQLDEFLEFVASQQSQIPDRALSDETAAIASQASLLKGVVQECRKQISDLAGVLAAVKDVTQAASLVAVQAQSEKALESLTLEAAEQIRKVDGLLEKIPAGGADVTRRTVLQQRLRSRFAEVQKTQHEMVETLNTLRPTVNFRLDAALTAVSGLARRLEDRQRALVEQIQQQDAQSRRIDYDRQLQQAQAESEELSVERDRLMARLTEATQEMLDAEPGRTRLIQVRAQIADLDGKIAAARTAVADARRKQTTLQAAASQPAVARLYEPEIVKPAANRTMRMVMAGVCGFAVAVLVFGGYAAVAGGRRWAWQSATA